LAASRARSSPFDEGGSKRADRTATHREPETVEKNSGAWNLDRPLGLAIFRWGQRTRATEHNAQKLKIACCVAIAHKRVTAAGNP
jgi:hypothetical protein